MQRSPNLRWYAVVVLLTVSSISGADAVRVSPKPINVAEAVIEPFWDPALSGLDAWTIDPGDAHGLVVTQTWASVAFEWTSRPASGPALRMTRRFNVDCSGYDRLVVAMRAPAGSVFHIMAVTDKGELTFTAGPAADEKAEHALDLQGAAWIDTVTMELDAASDGAAAGWFTWLGLQNTGWVARHLDQWAHFDPAWPNHIKDESYEPEFKPRYGILINEDELEDLRARHARFVEEHGESLFTRMTESARDAEPEKGIGEFAKSGGKGAYNRVRDRDRGSLGAGDKAAIAGVLLRDKQLLRVAARCALSIASCTHWENGFVCRFPGSSFELRDFRRGYCCEDLALIMDLAGEMFTETGRTYLLRRLAEQGMGPMNYCAWRYEYIFHCNQLAFFAPGRIYAYLVLEREWPRVTPYTDLAYQDILENFANVVLTDGGYHEGPNYFGATARRGCRALDYYARARGKDPFTVVPDVLRRTGDFALAVASTMPENDVIPICDSEATLDVDTLLTLALLMPESYWVTMCHKALARDDYALSSLARWQGLARLPRECPPPVPFVSLPDMGIMASTRDLAGHAVKLFIMGNKAGAEHTHEDKGSFVLEFAGDTFALDLGICSYSNPIHQLYKQCQRHNMLVPTGTAERPHPPNPLARDVKPSGQGDATAFHARIDASPGWEPYYTKWIRTWDSPGPATLVIRDEYDLATGDGVEFLWQTQLPVTMDGNQIVITGRQGTVTLHIPDGCTARIDELPLIEGVQRRIAIGKRGQSGTVEVLVTLHPR